MIRQDWMAAYSLWMREMIRFYRQPSRVVGAIASPLVFWLLIGFGFGHSFRTAVAGREQGYLEYFFPGTLLLIILFTAIFSTISLIEDKREGFMQAVLVAPVSRAGIVLGKVMGGTKLAAAQGLLFLIAAPFAGFQPGPAGWAMVLLALVLNGFLMTSLGFVFAWRMKSIQGFHAVMNLFLMPLWLLSGALFPPEGAPIWLQAAIRLNPLSYGLAALRHGLYQGGNGLAAVPSYGFSILLMALFSAGIFALAVFSASQRSAKDLPE